MRQLGKAFERLACLTRSSSSGLSTSAGEESILLRDYIHKQLYGPSTGYFNRERPPVAPLQSPLAFKSFLGKADYLSAVANTHEQLGVAWLTPSEIFTPYHGQAVAAHILKQHQSRSQQGHLKIYEIGGGTGTLAVDILDTMLQEDMATYESCTYTSCEISPVLAKQQEERLAGHSSHGKRFRVEVRDAADRGSWGDPDPDPCFILGMEVLDNCPHDKVVKARGGRGEWLQEEILTKEGKFSVQHRPLADPLIQRLLACAMDSEIPAPPLWERLYDMAVGYPSSGPYHLEDTIFLPSKAAMLFETLQAVRPNHNLIMADFSSLPDVQVKGRLAPLITSKAEGGPAVDGSTYLVEAGSADIVFPTDFDLLCSIYQHSAGSTVDLQATWESTADFMGKNADIDATTSRNGYNPLLEDFSNTAFLLGTSKDRAHSQ